MVLFALVPQNPLTAVGDATERTVARVGQVIVPRVDFEGTDVREALRQLLREALVGGTIAPAVQVTITVSLRNVPWETALQNVTRQVEASYRVDHGFLEVIRRVKDGIALNPDIPGPGLMLIELAYDGLRASVEQGCTGSSRERTLSTRRRRLSRFRIDWMPSPDPVPPCRDGLPTAEGLGKDG